MTASHITLGEASILITKGTTPTTVGFQFVDSGIPFLRAEDVSGGVVSIANVEKRVTSECHNALARSQLQAGDLLITIAGTVGRIGTVPNGIDAANCNQAVAIVRLKPGLFDLLFLCYFLRSSGVQQKFRQQGTTATITNVSLAQIRDIEVPNVPLHEQRRIVDLLSRAEGIVRLRREAEKKAAELIPALFLDMFGDPATNPKGWEVEEFGSVITYSRYGPRFPNRDYAESGAHILRTTDMSDDGFLRWWESPIMSLTPAEVAKYQLSPKTLLITRTGTIGRVAMFSGASEPCIAGAYLLEFGLKELISPDYALAFFLSAYGQQHLLQGSRSVAQPNINAPTVMAIKVPIPPMGRQAEFSKAVEGVRAIQSQQSAAIAKAQATFDALLAQAFS